MPHSSRRPLDDGYAALLATGYNALLRVGDAGHAPDRRRRFSTVRLMAFICPHQPLLNW